MCDGLANVTTHTLTRFWCTYVTCAQCWQVGYQFEASKAWSDFHISRLLSLLQHDCSGLASSPGQRWFNDLIQWWWYNLIQFILEDLSQISFHANLLTTLILEFCASFALNQRFSANLPQYQDKGQLWDFWWNGNIPANLQTRWWWAILQYNPLSYINLQTRWLWAPIICSYCTIGCGPFHRCSPPKEGWCQAAQRRLGTLEASSQSFFQEGVGSGGRARRKSKYNIKVYFQRWWRALEMKHTPL